MQKLSEWPIEWKKILLCTKHWQYNGQCEVWHKTTPLFEFYSKEEEWVFARHHFNVTTFGPQEVPLMPVMYGFRENVVFQLEKGGHWFVLSDGKTNSSCCSTCDGKTQTSCELIECFSLHDMVWSVMNDHERRILDIDDNYSSFPEFRKSITKTQLKKKLFR